MYKARHDLYLLDIQVGEEELPYMALCRILSNVLENAWFVIDVMVKTKEAE